jgi:hypothetical protein
MEGTAIDPGVVENLFFWVFLLNTMYCLGMSPRTENSSNFFYLIAKAHIEICEHSDRRNSRFVTEQRPSIYTSVTRQRTNLRVTDYHPSSAMSRLIEATTSGLRRLTEALYLAQWDQTVWLICHVLETRLIAPFKASSFVEASPEEQKIARSIVKLTEAKLLDSNPQIPAWLASEGYLDIAIKAANIVTFEHVEHV